MTENQKAIFERIDGELSVAKSAGDAEVELGEARSVALESENLASGADPLNGLWVTCDHNAKPHPYHQSFCEGVIQVVPALRRKK